MRQLYLSDLRVLVRDCNTRIDDHVYGDARTGVLLYLHILHMQKPRGIRRISFAEEGRLSTTRIRDTFTDRSVTLDPFCE